MGREGIGRQKVFAALYKATSDLVWRPDTVPSLSCPFCLCSQNPICQKSLALTNMLPYQRQYSKATKIPTYAILLKPTPEPLTLILHYKLEIPSGSLYLWRYKNLWDPPFKSIISVKQSLIRITFSLCSRVQLPVQTRSTVPQALAGLPALPVLMKNKGRN